MSNSCSTVSAHRDQFFISLTDRMPEEVEIKIDEFSANGSNIYTANWTFLPSRFGSSSAFFQVYFHFV